MQRIIVAAIVAGFILTSAAISLRADRPALTPAPGELQVLAGPVNPWTNLKVNNDKDEFQFAIVTDRTGGMRQGVFERSIEVLNLLQPEFVISVGDLISANANKDKVESEWRTFNAMVNQLEMPFFYLPGNHDVGTKVASTIWDEKFGRKYYHFVYRNVLFVMLNSEEPPEAPASATVTEDQRAYVEKTLNDNQNVRWTIVCLHKPLWAHPDVEKTNWLAVEKLLHGRPHTVFAGHRHRYEKFLRNGSTYYMLATTGGSSKLRGIPFGEFDQIVWVTMKKTGPRLANVMLDGVYPENIDTKSGTPAAGAPKP